jgi:hypothetical protein
MVRQPGTMCGYLYLSVSTPVRDNDRVAAAGIQRTLVTKATLFFHATYLSIQDKGEI